MKNHNVLITIKGQALTEMLLSISLILIFAAGLFQFALLFLSSVQFEHACGEAARLYAAGLISENSLEPHIHENLGPFRKFIDAESLIAARQDPRSNAAALAKEVQAAIGAIPFVSNVGGGQWVVRARFRPPSLFKTLFPDGIPLQTVLQVHRYPR